MTATFVKSITGTGSGVNSFALTLSGGATAGDFLAALYSIWNGATPSNATPTGGGTWSTTTAATPQNGANAFINYCPSATGGATTVTVTYGTGFYIEGAVGEWSGMHATPLDVQTSNSSAASTTPTSGTTGTTAQADELVLACLQVSESVVNVGIDPVTGYTNLRTQQDANATIGHSSDYKIVAATGTQAAAWGTLAGSYAWSGKIATFKGAAASGRTVNAATESLVLTAQPAAINRKRTVNAATESLVLTKQPATINRKRSVNAATESLVLTAQPAAINRKRTVNAATESLVLTAQPATVQRGSTRLVAATCATLVLTAQRATINRTRNVNAATESLVLTAQPATVNRGAVVVAPAAPSGFGYLRIVERKLEQIAEEATESEPELIPAKKENKRIVRFRAQDQAITQIKQAFPSAQMRAALANELGVVLERMANRVIKRIRGRAR